jgi:murein DD-endopeptidase MepM/ murein hydrolase activator NlpD
VCNVAVVALIAGMSAACSNSVRMSEPLFTGSTANQREILGQNGGDVGGSDYQPMPAAVAGNDAVTRSDLPPPAMQSYASNNSYGGGYSDPAPAAQPAYDGDGASVYGWSAVGGKVMTVAQGETLDNIAVKYGVPGGQILSANQLSSAAQIRPGKVIVIPRRVAMAPGAARQDTVAYDQPMARIPAPSAAPRYDAPRALAANDGDSYTVHSGYTLFSVARDAGMKAPALAAMNGLTTDTQLKIGQHLRLKPGAGATLAAAEPQPKVLGAPARPLGQLVVNGNGAATGATMGDGSLDSAAAPKIRLASPADSAETGRLAMDAPKIPVAPALPTETPAATDASLPASVDDIADPASVDGKQFRWPVRGRIISGFGSKANGEKNDGINLAVPEGTSVKAVEAGTVIYAGNELANYGNLVLVRHADGWVSAYAHNKDIVVKRGDKVRRGQTVAHAGMSGSVSSPQVHFELRKGAKPVNPLDYLAGA